MLNTMRATMLVVLAACGHATATDVVATPPVAAARQDGWLELPSGKTHYIAEGQGVPCLAYGIANYQPQLFSARLKERIRFYFVDLPHWTDPDDAPAAGALTYDDVIKAMEDARVALHLDHMGLCGHSMMGLLSLGYAARYPEHVAWVLALGSPPTIAGLWDLEDSYFDANASADRKAILDKNLAEMKAEPTTPDFVRAYKARAPMYFYDATYDPTPLYRDTHMNMGVTKRMLKLLTDTDVPGEFPKIRAPVFLALGAADYAMPIVMWTDELKHRLKALTVKVYAKSGHYVPIEERDVFDRELVDWLATLPRS